METSSFLPRPICKKSLSDEVVERMQEMITNNELKPGQRLPAEMELASLFSVSRATIREAITTLSTLGVVDREKRGIYVSEMATHPVQELYMHLMLDNYDIGELYEARLVLEGPITRLACMRISDEKIKKLEGYLDEMQGDDIDRYVSADLAYHDLIMASAENKVVYEIYKVMRFLLRKSIREYVDYPEVRDTSREGHRRILQSIKERDFQSAEIEMTAHIQELIDLRKKIMRI